MRRQAGVTPDPGCADAVAGIGKSAYRAARRQPRGKEQRQEDGNLKAIAIPEDLRKVLSEPGGLIRLADGAPD